MGTNRDKVKDPKRTKIWCSHCDAQKVQPGSKCPRCHNKEFSKALKKGPKFPRLD